MWSLRSRGLLAATAVLALAMGCGEQERNSSGDQSGTIRFETSDPAVRVRPQTDSEKAADLEALKGEVSEGLWGALEDCVATSYRILGVGPDVAVSPEIADGEFKMALRRQIEADDESEMIVVGVTEDLLTKVEFDGLPVRFEQNSHWVVIEIPGPVSGDVVIELEHYLRVSTEARPLEVVPGGYCV